jgi:hypothetical protein
MDVSVIIVNYNTKNLTLACINSIFEKTSGLKFEVILVDNGSNDGSQELFCSDQRIKYIYSETNLGFGRANNLGYEKALGDYLFLLNSDTYLVNNAIYLLWRQMKDAQNRLRTQKVACAGCMLTDVYGNVVHSYAHFPSMWQSFCGATIYPMLWKLHIISCLPNTSNYVTEFQKDLFFDVDYITGADLMVQRCVADELGLFDPDFFMYSEETEMQYRYMKAGYRRLVFFEPQIVHLEGKSNRKTSPSRATQAMRSELLYFKKTSSSIQYIIFSFFYKLGHVLTCLITFPFMTGEFKEKLKHILDVMKN